MSDSSSNVNNTSFDSSNPLYLHPSDHPGLILVSKSFDGSGFGAWKRAIAISLSAKNKLGFIYGTISRPADSSLALWQQCNDMVISWILNTLSREISESVLYTETAQQLWTELNDRYGQTNGAKLYQLQKNLCQISQASHLIAKREEDQRLVQFLMGLNPSYDNVRGNILMMQPLPSINQAYALLIQDENQREIHSTNPLVSESTAINVASQASNSRFDNKKYLTCSHCKKSGHSVNKCYRLVGFPKDFKFTKVKRFAGKVAVDEDNIVQVINSNISQSNTGCFGQKSAKDNVSKYVM
ncbi:uncharacterized protein LOC143579153 [Bidens hawaiensis]|uniref:uncharacterized protein LOC143579153 n=1 Tax=Bidens hawaiensis TaxID=980011 RepID=UPI00404942AA